MISKIRKIFINNLMAVFILALSLPCVAYDYPKSHLEKEMDDMGSVLDNDGIIFKPSKERSRATNATIGNVNKYLFKASIDILSFAPLATADSTGGVVITEWYNINDQKDTQVKITVFINDEVISAESIGVVAFERKKVNGSWTEASKKPSLASALEDKILRKARNLYLKESNK